MTLTPPWSFDNPMCKDAGLDLFYREDEPKNTPEYKQAVSLCKSCKHRIECAEWGIHKERWGIWGGLSPNERHNIRRSRRRFGNSSVEIELLP